MTTVLDVIGYEGKVISTTVANLEQGAAWIISLDVIHQQGANSLHMECSNHPQGGEEERRQKDKQKNV